MDAMRPISMSINYVGSNRYLFQSDETLNDNIELPDNTEIILRNDAHVSCGNLTLGRNSLICIESGVLTVKAGCKLTLGEGSRLDARSGVLDLVGARCDIRPESTLMLSDYPVRGGTLAGGWGAIPVSWDNGDYKFHKYRSYLQAPISRVFDGTEFVGHWDMDRAYPQWFADADCDDWSEPINKAIDLKGSGEVFLPAGIYYVKRTIRVRVGIQLVGEAGMNLNYGEVNSIGTDVNATVIVPIQTVSTTAPSAGASTLTHRFARGIVIAVNLQSQYLIVGDSYEPATGNTEEEKYNNWKKANTVYDVHEIPMMEVGYQVPGTLVRYIKIDNSYTFSVPDKSNPDKRFYSGLPYLCGVCAAGCAHIDCMAFVRLWQSIAWSNDYADHKKITGCWIAKYSTNNRVINSDGTPAIGPDGNDSTYAIHAGFLGDALVIQGNMVHDHDNTKGVYVGSSSGATINSNIFNCHVLLNQCFATTFADNHLENIDAQLQIKNGNVTVQGNYFQKGSKPSIVIIPDGHALAIVTCMNNTFRWIRDEGPVSDESVDYMSSICKYDISFIERNSFNMPNQRIIATVSISHCYRQYKGYNIQEPLPFGVLLCTQRDSYPENKRSCESINYLSPLVSMSSVITPGERVSMPVTVCMDINRIKMYFNSAPGISGKDPLWLGPTASFSYSYRLVWDMKRGIYAHDGNGHSLLGLCENVMVYSYSEDIPSRGEVLFSLSTDGGNPEESGMLFYVIMYRKSVTLDGKVMWEKVEVPVCGGSLLYDNGICVCGFKWERCPEPQEMPFNDGITGIEYHGQNVVVYSTKRVDFAKGQWSVGDRVYNVGEDESWVMQIKK